LPTITKKHSTAKRKTRICALDKAPYSMSEHHHQVALFQWASRSEGRYPELAAMYSVPNGGARSKAAAGKLKAEGVRAGIPDICLPLRTNRYGALYIELKAPAENGKPAGRVSVAQRNMIAQLTDLGNCVRVAYGWEDAMEEILVYLAEYPAGRKVG
jgi:hypothetical protein